MVKGSWVPQRQFDDPMWRKNVYDPWMAQVQNAWRLKMEEANKWRQQNAGGPPGFMNFGGAGRRSGGAVGSSAAGGGGMQFDPAIIAQLMGG